MCRQFLAQGFELMREADAAKAGGRPWSELNETYERMLDALNDAKGFVRNAIKAGDCTDGPCRSYIVAVRFRVPDAPCLEAGRGWSSMSRTSPYACLEMRMLCHIPEGVKHCKSRLLSGLATHRAAPSRMVHALSSVGCGCEGREWLRRGEERGSDRA